jgi:gag-polypeptide of LTR copia-type
LIASANEKEWKECETAKETLENEQQYNPNKNFSHKYLLYSQLGMQMREGENIRNHLARFENILFKLKYLQMDGNGDDIPSELLMAMFINSLPLKYRNDMDTFTLMFESMNKSEPLTFDTLRRFVIANYVTK